MLISEFDTRLQNILDFKAVLHGDIALNGLQVGQADREVRKAAFAVDACLDSFNLAADWGADILVVHHGLMWGHQFAWTGLHYDRLAFLCQHHLALYAAHLPLDRHPELGNNAGLAFALGLTETQPFGVYKGLAIGVKGRLPRPLRLEEVSQKLFGDARGTLGFLPFGKTFNETVGIVSGGAADEVFDAIDQGLDLYITGDSSHEIYHSCQEAGINVLFGGHYQTETWGVSLLAKKVSAEFGIETRFFDIPTGY